MGRRPTDAAARLRASAIDLYTRDGFGATTVEAIAADAGLTERTFFRYYADKREVLFGGADELAILLAERVTASGASTVREAVVEGLLAVCADLEPRRPELVTREAIVSTTLELRERELAKLAAWSSALEAALIGRGADAPSAAVVASASVAALNVAATRWLAGPGRPGLRAELGAALQALTLLA
ncbi:TetR family transcriptional regulator [Frondihabitans sucicola]|uniref:TetR family transcriptional regulator n=1 Tax=Frondihabitans sucicola TaxID=1268041 RepID=A0ABM8GQW3_9MICO|nr:TetR family transcriptional regulator [Frondihabitans sucicola]BDZ50813.1 TetR family transcriptional regulator [Frondihabitans sucicola]